MAAKKRARKPAAKKRRRSRPRDHVDFPDYQGPTWARQEFVPKRYRRSYDPYAQAMKEAGDAVNYQYDGRDGGIIRLQIARVRESVPKRTRYGQLYAKLEQTKRSYKRVTLLTLFVSDENHRIFRRHLFESKKLARTPKEWDAWFTKHLAKIHRENVLGGLTKRTGGRDFWAVKRLIGWIGDARSVPRAKRADISKAPRKRKKAVAAQRTPKKKRGRNARRKK